MSFLANLTPDQEREILHEIRTALLSPTKRKISVWPTEFLQKYNIQQDFHERELKVLEIDLHITLARIYALHPLLLFHGHIEDIRYDFPDTNKKKIAETMRIRRKNNNYFLTIKKPNTSKILKDRLEFEIPLSLPEVFEDTFEALGLIHSHVKNKVRLSYKMSDDLLIDIDMYPGIPPLLEVEGPNRESIMNLIKKLELHKNKIVNRSAREMLVYYKRW